MGQCFFPFYGCAGVPDRFAGKTFDRFDFNGKPASPRLLALSRRKQHI
jgi:hypothetical protein